jgi:hypothetical protein
MGKWSEQIILKKKYKWPMTSKYIKKCSKSLAIKDMQSKTTLRFHLSLVRTAIIKNTNNKCWWGCRGRWTFIYYWWKCKSVQPLWRCLKKLKIELPYDPVIALLGTYPKECKLVYKRGTCTSIFIAALYHMSHNPAQKPFIWMRLFWMPSLNFCRPVELN